MRAYKFNLFLENINEICKSDHSIESMKFITSLISPEKYPKILDIGCGEGKEAYVLQQLGYNVTAITQGIKNITYAKQNYPNTNIYVMDMHDLEFSKNSFNAIYIHHAFEHSIAPLIQLVEMWCVLTDNPYGLVWIGLPHSKESYEKNFHPEIHTISPHHKNMVSKSTFIAQFNLLFNIKMDMSEKYTSKINSIYFDQAYLLEKKPFNQLRQEIQQIVKERIKIFG